VNAPAWTSLSAVALVVVALAIAEHRELGV